MFQKTLGTHQETPIGCFSRRKRPNRGSGFYPSLQKQPPPPVLNITELSKRAFIAPGEIDPWKRKQETTPNLLTRTHMGQPGGIAMLNNFQVQIQKCTCWLIIFTWSRELRLKDVAVAAKPSQLSGLLRRSEVSKWWGFFPPSRKGIRFYEAVTGASVDRMDGQYGKLS